MGVTASNIWVLSKWQTELNHMITKFHIFIYIQYIYLSLSLIFITLATVFDSWYEFSTARKISQKDSALFEYNRGNWWICSNSTAIKCKTRCSHSMTRMENCTTIIATDSTMNFIDVGSLLRLDSMGNFNVASRGQVTWSAISSK